MPFRLFHPRICRTKYSYLFHSHWWVEVSLPHLYPPSSMRDNVPPPQPGAVWPVLPGGQHADLHGAQPQRDLPAPGNQRLVKVIFDLTFSLQGVAPGPHILRTGWLLQWMNRLLPIPPRVARNLLLFDNVLNWLQLGPPSPRLYLHVPERKHVVTVHCSPFYWMSIKLGRSKQSQQ